MSLIRVSNIEYRLTTMQSAHLFVKNVLNQNSVVHTRHITVDESQ
jgi:hypothetical protein